MPDLVLEFEQRQEKLVEEYEASLTRDRES